LLSVSFQLSNRLLSVQAVSLQQQQVASAQSFDDQSTSSNIRRNINRVYLSGTVTTKPFFGTSRNGVRFSAVRIVTNSFGGQYDFRVRLTTRTSVAYCREHVHEGSRLFVFGRLATFPRIAADGTQGTSGSIIASRISVEQGSVVPEEEHFEDIDLSAADDDFEQTAGAQK
uniref:Single-stranded DNA-binding protein n=1 Tax=Gongylonema pulchrum TaxID=637853 RepID=A0A183DRL3_9BILA